MPNPSINKFPYNYIAYKVEGTCGTCRFGQKLPSILHFIASSETMPNGGVFDCAMLIKVHEV